MAPLHHAALSGNKELISLLLEAQATVDIKDHKGTNTDVSDGLKTHRYHVMKHNPSQETFTSKQEKKPECLITPQDAIES